MSRAMEILASAVLAGLCVVLIVALAGGGNTKGESPAGQAGPWQQRYDDLVAQNEELYEKLEESEARATALAGESETLRSPTRDGSAEARARIQDLEAKLAEGNRTAEGLRREVASLTGEPARAGAAVPADQDDGRLEELLAQRAKVAGELADMSELMLDLGLPDCAATLLESAVELGAATPQVLYSLAHCHGELGDDEAAAECYERAVRAAEESLQDRGGFLCRLYCNYGATLARLGRPEEALECYTRSVEADGHYAPVHFNLGLLYEGQLGRPAEAVESYRRHVALGGSRSVAARDAIVRLLDEHPETEAQARPAGTSSER